MANSLASLVPILINEESVPYLQTKLGITKRLYTVREQEKRQEGGQVVKVTMPASRFVPTNVSYTTPATAQVIQLPSATITFDQQKEVIISLNELEARITQGNQERILREVMNGMIDGLLNKIETDVVATIIPLAAHTVGTYNTDITDRTIRQAMLTLQNNRVDPLMQKVSLRTTAKVYSMDILGIDRYVVANNIGQGINPNLPDNPITGGKIPKLYNLDADWSAAIPTITTSGVNVAQNLMFEEYFAAIGFLDFIPTNILANGSAALTETFTVDPDSGITIRWQMFFNNDLRTMYLRCDATYGYNVLDATRGVQILSREDVV